MRPTATAMVDPDDGPDDPEMFINKWSRLRCNDCFRTLLRGEAGYRIPSLGDRQGRPTGPIWCGARLSTRTGSDQ